MAVITANFSALTAGRDVTKLAGQEVTDGLVLQFTPLSHVNVYIHFYVISLYAAFQKLNETLCKQISWVYFVVFFFTKTFQLLYLLP